MFGRIIISVNYSGFECSFLYGEPKIPSRDVKFDALKALDWFDHQH